MNTKTIFLSLLQLSVAVILGVIILYISFVLIKKLLVKRFDLHFNNTAFGILCAAILFSVGYIMAGIVDPAINSFRVLSHDASGADFLIFKFLQYIVMFTFIGLTISLLVSFLSLKLFSLLTKEVDEFEEIQKNNIAVAIISSSIVITISLFVKSSVVMLLESLIPYPHIPGLH